ncbi:MAG: Pr6Pr family membrane protein [Firmicutes bacterium]|nr:Pr6Pr family membrane protein [Bacillota bacterium]
MKGKISLTSKKTCILLLAFGFLGLAVVIFFMAMWPNFKQFASNQRSGLNYFAYFTYLSNTVVFIWLILTGISGLCKKEKMQRFLIAPQIFGAVFLYTFIVGFIFYGILRWIVTPYPWSVWYARLADFFNHGLTPLFMTLLFIFSTNETQKKLTQKHVLLWLIYPFVYFVFSMVRGAIINWYPYPFINPAWQPYAAVSAPPILLIILAAAAFMSVFYLLGFATMKLSNKKIAKCGGQLN